MLKLKLLYNKIREDVKAGLCRVLDWCRKTITPSEKLSILEIIIIGKYEAREEAND